MDGRLALFFCLGRKPLSVCEPAVCLLMGLLNDCLVELIWVITRSKRARRRWLAGSTCCLRLKNLQPSWPPPLRMKLGFHFRQLSALWLLLHSTPLLAALQSLARSYNIGSHTVCWGLDFFLYKRGCFLVRICKE